MSSRIHNQVERIEIKSAVGICVVLFSRRLKCRLFHAARTGAKNCLGCLRLSPPMGRAKNKELTPCQNRKDFFLIRIDDHPEVALEWVALGGLRVSP